VISIVPREAVITGSTFASPGIVASSPPEKSIAKRHEKYLRF
jgi:hypothetical protein